MRSEFSTYFSLVRAALWGEQVQWTEEHTQLLLALHAQQGTGALVFPFVLGLETLSAAVRAQMKSVCMATMQNQVALQYTLEKAWKALQDAGIHAVLMKGAGLAALYPEPYYRAWGDIDLYVGPEQYHPACAVMRETFPTALKFDEELDHYKHYNLIADGVSIEVHRVTVSLQHPRDERLYAAYEREGMEKAEPLMLNGVEVRVPEPTFNALLIFLHSWEHMLSAGANVRQICDLTLLLHHYKDRIDVARLRKYLRSLRLMDAWKLYAYVMHTYLGLPREEALFYTDAVAARAERMTEDLLSGQMRTPKDEQQAPKGRLARKIYTMRSRVANAQRIAPYSPAYARHMVWTTWLHGARRLFAPDRHWE